MKSYTIHYQPPWKVGDKYRALSICNDGDHSSVALAMGLQTMLRKEKKVKVEAVHLSARDGGWSHLCDGQCKLCRMWDGRGDDEREVAGEVKHRAGIVWR